MTDSTSYSQRLEMVVVGLEVSKSRQTELLWISRSSLYYQKEYSLDEKDIMNLIDEIYTDHVYYWSRRISAELKKRWHKIWRKKVKKHMQIMWICAMYPKKKTSIANKENKKYPYLLKWIEITKPNQVRSTDITYIKIPGWFVYLLAVLDRYSRKVIAWDVSPSMDKEFCCGVLKKALSQATPEIFNSDQWSQFTSSEFTELLENANVKISMDGLWRCFDNIRIERLWRTVKYEDIYLNEYKTSIDVYHGLANYFNKYNNSRLHSSIWYKTPSEVYVSKN